ncbi:predicted protein [Histoplasma capsulatum var. duboisii H88]|uniref:Predicted protein n=1 Tax=Ajellomyces capsulatus (strain H88) TaxID=544711 RepID=F0U4T2_AJEC8|nr:predicted protein [Histoplasma capsulatum var. duboisii H88]
MSSDCKPRFPKSISDAIHKRFFINAQNGTDYTTSDQAFATVRIRTPESPSGPKEWNKENAICQLGHIFPFVLLGIILGHSIRISHDVHTNEYLVVYVPSRQLLRRTAIAPASKFTLKTVSHYSCVQRMWELKQGARQQTQPTRHGM